MRSEVKWSDPRPILSIHYAARSLNVRGRSGREVIVASENVRPALQQQSFAQLVQEGIGALNETATEQTVCLESNTADSVVADTLSSTHERNFDADFFDGH